MTIALVAVAGFSGCAGDEEEPLVQDIRSASVTVDTSACPLQVSAELQVEMNACDELLPPVIERAESEVQVRLEVQSTAEACIASIIEVTEVVPLGAFDPGQYDLVVESLFQTSTTPFTVDAACTE